MNLPGQRNRRHADVIDGKFEIAAHLKFSELLFTIGTLVTLSLQRYLVSFPYSVRWNLYSKNETASDTKDPITFAVPKPRR